MPAKRNDIEEESAADREIAFTRVILAWALVLVILFWITSTPPPTEGRSVQLWIRGSLVQGSLDGDDPSTQSEGESEEGTEIIRASLAMPQVFGVARRTMRKAWTDPKQFEMTATFADEDGRTRLTMRMVFVPAARDQNAQEYGSIEGGKQTLERLAEHLSARFAAQNEEE
jgi:type IV secretory pathway TrbD component